MSFLTVAGSGILALLITFSVVGLLVGAIFARLRPKALDAFTYALVARWSAVRAAIVAGYRERERFREFDRALADFRRNAPVSRQPRPGPSVGTPRE